jgi:hypothetical protein
VTIHIGVDYDEPMYPWYDYAHDVSVAAGLTSPDAPPPTRWDPHSHYGCTQQEWYDVLNAEVRKGLDGMYGRPLKPGVVEDMQRLYDEIPGVLVHIVTARGQFGEEGKMIQELTRAQIASSGLPHDSLHFTPKKAPVVRRLGISKFVDDGPHNYEDLQFITDTFLYDERWNQHVPVPRARRVKSFGQFVDRVVWDYRYATV